MTPSTVFTLASMTKLITTIAVLQLVERGQLGLDEDITPHVPALARQPILSPSSPSKAATTTPRKNPITLRHLLTQTSGISYPFLNPALGDFKAKETGSSDPIFGATVAERYGLPLLFEPGTQWAYGASLDWAGSVLESVTGVDLETWVQQHILSPLGIPRESMTFFPHKIPGLVDSARFAKVSVRNESTKRVEFAPGESERYLISEDAFGGEGLYGSLTAYAEVMHSLLLDDGRLLSPETTAKMFVPAIPTPEAKASLLRQLETPDWIVGVVPPTGEYDWGLGGLLVDGDSHPYRRRGALFWSGMFNLIWVSIAILTPNHLLVSTFELWPWLLTCGKVH
jgi:CubicO group peptidase (beta-lactamase class C family)